MQVSAAACCCAVFSTISGKLLRQFSTHVIPSARQEGKGSGIGGLWGKVSGVFLKGGSKEKGPVPERLRGGQWELGVDL